MKSLVKFLILSTVTIVSWLFFEIYREATSEAPPVVPAEVVADMQQLDTASLDKLDKRFFTVDYIQNPGVPSQTPIPSPTPTDINQGSFEDLLFEE